MIPLDDAVIRPYLVSSRVMRLATLSGRGRPSLTPIWFVVAGGRLIVGTAASSVAARNVTADPRVTVLLDGSTAGSPLLRLRGLGVVQPGLPPLGIIARIGLKYYVAPGAVPVELRHLRLWNRRRRYYAQGEAVWISIEPTAAELIPPT